MNTRKSGACIREAEAFAAEHDPDPAHASQVCRNALALFDSLRDFHGMGPGDRVLLHAAALMHDTGYGAGVAKHNKASRDRILSQKLTGLSIRELMMIACIARYHTGPEPDPDHKVYRDLKPREQEKVARLAAMLRIADGLDRSHAQSAEALHVDCDGATVRIHVVQPAAYPGDIAAAVRKGRLFEKVFGVTLEISAE
ncbi:MAG TPA: HD domain-containing protein [Candidatus Hydrogenedentes bacterium]|nr:HD domain-containing protein [Candidatus Hydrogenedentota bacterium]HOT51261.1 HD domain-containing protein [Candidatus Hydrogenedentota bacterium]HOV73736.1 HD domain-containing protein [Candidatus Hydrogenedentota bacterium]HPC17083.1 HD domain-containing protein [Candidatus Hydrogenedentota bacterium]HRT20534.1 HD domain-containing protein [Candidatus Hydrogenedentota bacterium]